MKLIFQVRPEKKLFISFFVFELSDRNFDGFVIFLCGINNSQGSNTIKEKSNIRESYKYRNFKSLFIKTNIPWMY